MSTKVQTRGHSKVVATIRREAQQTSVRKVARRIGKSPSYVSEIIRGTRRVSESIAAAFGFEREITTIVVFRKAA